MEEEIREYPILVPHSDYGDPECCGIIMAVEREDGQADLTCNDCGVVIRTVPGAVAESTLIEMALTAGFSAETCPHGNWALPNGGRTMI